MRAYNEKMDNMVRKGKIKRWLLGSSAVLSLAIVLVVVGMLIKPAISLSKDEIEEDNFSTSTAVSLNDKLTDAKITTSKPVDGDTVNATINIKYTCPANDTVTKDTDNKYVYLQLEDNVKAKAGTSGEVTDADYTKYINDNGLVAAPAGDYYITDDGKVVIKFRDEYLEYRKTRGVQDGTFNFNADFERGEDKSSSSYDYKIGNKTVTVTGYTQEGVGIDKTVKDNGNGTATWTVTIYNPNYNSNSADKMDNDGSWFEDNSLKEASNIKIQAYNKDGVLQTTNSNIEVHDAGGQPGTKNTLWIYGTFPTYTESRPGQWGWPSQNVTMYYPKYVISYDTPFVYDDAQYQPNQMGYEASKSNTALYHYNNKDITKTTTVSHTSKVNVYKSNPTYDYANKLVKWDINVNNPDGLNLNGFKITDSAFNNLASGTTVTSNSGANYNVSGDVLTLNSDFTGTLLQFSYSVPVTSENESGENEVSIKDKDDNDLGSDKKGYNYDQYWINKNGSVNKSSQEITWEIWIEDRNESGSLTGTVIDDSMLQYAIDGSISVNNDVTWPYDSVPYTKDENGKIVIGDNAPRKIKVTYRTPFYVDESHANGGVYTKDEVNNTEKVTYVNDVGFEINGLHEETSKTVEISTINELYKNSYNVVISEDYSQMSIDWEVETKQDEGTFSGKTITDTITLPNGFTLVNNLDQITFTVSGNYDNVGLVKGTDYDITCDNANGNFVVTFKDTEKVNSLNEAKVKYTTVINIDLDATDAEVIYSVKNDVNCNKKNTSKTENYFRPDFSIPPYDKTIDGSTELELKSSDLVKEGDYYVFKYSVNINNAKRFKTENHNWHDFIVIEDTMDEGFVLCKDKEIKVHWGVNWSELFTDGSTKTREQLSEKHEYIYDSATRKILFAMYYEDGITAVTYYAKVPCSVIDAKINAGQSYVATNTVKHDKYGSVEQKVTVTPEQKHDDSVISKGGSQNGTGYYKYNVDINKEGQSLVPAGETLTLIDTMRVDKYTTGVYPTEDSLIADLNTPTDGTNLEISPEISFIKIYKIKEDGTNGEEIKGWKYTFTPNPVTEHKFGDNTLVYKTTSYLPDPNNIWWSVELAAYEIPVKPSTTYTITEVLPNGSTVNQIHTDVRLNYTTVNDRYDGPQNGQNVFTYTTPDDIADGTVMRLALYGGQDNLDYITVSDGETIWGTDYTTIDSVGKMAIVGLPDATPMRIVYTVRAVDSNNEYAAAQITNEASLMGTGYSDSESSYYIISERSEATVSGTKYLSLEKVDVGNYEVKLSAGFYLYKYDNGSWIPAKSINIPTDDPEADYYVVNWSLAGDTTKYELIKEPGSVLNLQLEENVLYWIEENKEPDEFTGKDEFFGKDDNYTTDFFFSFLAEPDTDAKGKSLVKDLPNYKVISSGSKYYIENVRKINIEVTKEWVGLPAQYKNTVVAEFELYRTTDLSLDNPSTIEKVDLNDLIENNLISANCVNQDNNTIRLTGDGVSGLINNLPNGKKNNEGAYYYYVKEVRYSLDGNEWVNVSNETSTFKPFYTGNYTSGDAEGNAFITVTNTSDLTVKKAWKGLDNKIITDTSKMPAITFRLYRIEAGSASGDDIYQPENLVCEFVEKDGNDESKFYTLSNDNKYMIAINTSEIDSLYGYTPGTKYEYYVKEDVPDNCQVLYNNNGTDGVSIITVTNITEVKNETITLPETGRGGVTKIIFLGLALAVISLVALGTIKRRKETE